MKSWKKRLFDELGEMTPKADERFATNGSPSPKKSFSLNKKRFAAAVASLSVIAVIAVVLCVTLISPSGSGAIADKSIFLTVEINPEAVFSVNKDGLVDAVIALNGDADVVLNSKNSPVLIGKPVSDALNSFLEETTRLGFIDPYELSAIRVSASEDKSNSLPAITASVENYFRLNGSKTLVADKVISRDELSKKCGLPDGSDLAAGIKSLSPSYATRAATSLDENALETLYKNEFVHGQIKTILSESISSLPDKLAKISGLLDDIKRGNDNIRDHRDNPLIFVKDFWSVKNSGYELTGEFASLVNETEEKLTEYTRLTGKKINSYSEFVLANETFSAFYATVPVDLIKRLSVFMSDADFDYYVDKLLDLLDKAGDKTGKIIGELLSVDKLDFDKFSSCVSTVYEQARETRLIAFGEKFSLDRAEISGEEYGSFIKKVVAEYGSLDAYYEFLKK